MSGSDEQLKKAVDKRLSTLNTEIALAIIVAFIALAIWDQHPVSIAYLTVKDAVGFGTVQNRKDLSDLCLKSGMYSCTERMYRKLSQKEPDYAVKLGRLQFGRGEYKEAAKTFHAYFEKGGNDIDASYYYARTLGELGKIDSASYYFDRTLRARPGFLQITVVEDYLRVLARAGRMTQARHLIRSVSRKDRQVAHEMEAEFKRIRKGRDQKG